MWPHFHITCHQDYKQLANLFLPKICYHSGAHDLMYIFHSIIPNYAKNRKTLKYRSLDSIKLLWQPKTWNLVFFSNTLQNYTNHSSQASKTSYKCANIMQLGK